MPAYSLLAALAWRALLRRVVTRAAVIQVGAGLLVVSLAPALWANPGFRPSLTPAAVSREVYGFNPFPEAIEIAKYLREHTDPQDRIVVIGSEPEIYFYAQRRSAVSYIYMYPLMEQHPHAQRMQEEMIEQIRQAKPAFIVFVGVHTSWTRRSTSPDLIFRWAENEIANEYEVCGVIDIQSDSVTRSVWGEAARQAVPESQYYLSVFERRDRVKR